METAIYNISYKVEKLLLYEQIPGGARVPIFDAKWELIS